MDTQTFISKFFEHGSWPAAAVVIILLLRSQLQELISSIKKLKAGPVEVELERFVKELEKTKQVAEAADAKASVVAAKFEEGEDETVQTPLETEPEAQIKTDQVLLSKVERTVLEAMVNSRFVSRSVSGVAKDTGLSRPSVQAAYGALISKGLVAQVSNSEGRPRWVVTALGRAIASET